MALAQPTDRAQEEATENLKPLDDLLQRWASDDPELLAYLTNLRPKREHEVKTAPAQTPTAASA